MAMIKCYECGKDISSQSSACIGCGAPTKISIENRFPRRDLVKNKTILGKLLDLAIKAMGKIVDFVKEFFTPQAEKDAKSLDDLINNPNSNNQKPKTKSQIDCDAFQAALESTIDVKVVEILSSKKDGENYLNYVDAQKITVSVRNIFKRILNFTPPQINASCTFAEAILAPSTQEKKNLIKSAFTMAGGAAGIGFVITGIGTALGWGASMIASLTAVFVGTSVFGPLVWVIGGLSLAAAAGYFATTSNKHTDTERFIKVLKKGCENSVIVMWDEHGDKLSTSFKDNQSTV